MSKNWVDSARASTALLGAGDGFAAIVENPGASSPFLLIGDHAGRAVPQALGDLGVAAAEFERHIAWDIGVAGVGHQLAGLLGATFIQQRYSRLVIDCNRDPTRIDAVPEISDGAKIPANVGLTAEGRAARIAAIFAPYHAAIAAELDRRAAAGLATTVIALHSFTPAMAGFVRPWRFGVLHQDNSGFSRAARARLRMAFGDEVGDNQPYLMDEV
ncbi:MAG: hypothetical protein JWO33_1901, partial [Caulobacteraceae bacterium]|nr:hypothetical protein [Caulobacteraceae bacterium]